ncbi:MAG: carboxynorspermidine decarboxylase [Deltaproteobacteria bacterium]|nr:carboxynorspermidine decarboxylase [Deltaproteobacteria bacterium]
MEREDSLTFDLQRLHTPCFVLDMARLRANLEILSGLTKRTGCRILLALKAFSMFNVFADMRDALHGVCASSAHEARLGREEFGGEVHTFAPAFKDSEFDDILQYSDYIVFNSFSMLERFGPRVAASKKPVSCGLRINPECSAAPAAIYDPCAPGSRLGVRAKDLAGKSLKGISGLHFHALCEQGADALERVLDAFERGFSPYLYDMSWVNLGGGHHITRPGYDLDRLCCIISRMREKYGVTVYLEPGEAVVLNAGFLVASVLDIVTNERPTAIIDASAATHMPDVLEMPYRPDIIGAGSAGDKAHAYTIAGPTCLSGDIIGDYSFDIPLQTGSRIVFTDMAHYTMVKTNTFNGINLPSIYRWDSVENGLALVRKFGYDDFKSRLS